MRASSSSFIPGISLIRIILCLMICIFHWKGWSSVGGGVGVDWFIVLSGFLMIFTLKEKKFSDSSFYISKFARLWPLLFTAFLLSALVSYKSQFNINNLLSVFIASFGGNEFVYRYTGNNYALWYMKLEILFVLLFPLVAYGRKYLILMLGISFATALACIFLKPNEQLYTYPPYRLWQFFAGCYAAQLYRKHERFLPWSPLIFVSGILYLFFQAFIGTSWITGEKVSSLGFLLVDTLIAILAIFSACSLEKHPKSSLIKIPSDLIHLINRTSLLSYAIFPLHIPVLQFMQNFWANHHYEPHSAIFWLSSCLLLIIVGIIVHCGIEQPCGKWLSSKLKQSLSFLKNSTYSS